jgi:hypothetical protein
LEESSLSEVYDNDSRRALFQVWKAQCRLAIAITDIIGAICTPGETKSSHLKHTNHEEFIIKAKSLQKQLSQWYDATTHGVDFGEAVVENMHVSLFKEVTLLYFQYFTRKNIHMASTPLMVKMYSTAQLALYDHTMLVVGTCDIESHIKCAYLTQLRDEFCSAIEDITRVAKHIVRRGCTLSLPMTV